MTNRVFFPLMLIPLLLYISCAGSPGAGVPAPSPEVPASENSAKTTAQPEPDGTIEQEKTVPAVPEGMVFHPAEFPSLEIPVGVGFITREKSDLAASLSQKEKDVLSGSYRIAYIDNLLRGIPLTGVLGGDLVHAWPASNPLSWVQNWSISGTAVNSWGLPSLVLAVGGLPSPGVGTGGDKVPGGIFIVQGKVLDQYGKSAGVKNANGNTGYGSPRGYEFLYEGKLAQRFDLGIIIVDADGTTSFLSEDPPSLSLDPPSDIGVFRDAGVSTVSAPDVRSAFMAAWKMALDRNIGTMTSDGPGQYLSLSGASSDFSGEQTVRGFYLQSFNRRTVLLILPDSSALPFYPRLVIPPFLDVLLGSAIPSGGEDLKPLDIKFTGGDEFSRAVMKGLTLYGIPLSDPVPVNFAAASDKAGSPVHWQLGQRFSQGWLVEP